MATLTCAPAAPALPMAAPALPPAPSQFAFARIHGTVHLVQVPACPSSALAPVDVNVFRHEFISVFRFSHALAVHPADFALLARIDARAARHEEDAGTVFLARAEMERLRKWTAGGAMQMQQMQHVYARQHAQGTRHGARCYRTTRS